MAGCSNSAVCETEAVRHPRASGDVTGTSHDVAVVSGPSVHGQHYIALFSAVRAPVVVVLRFRLSLDCVLFIQYDTIRYCRPYFNVR